MSTTTEAFTLAKALDQANPNLLATALQKVALGTLLTPTVKAITQTSATTVTLNPPALCPAVVSARVTAGTALAGVYRCTDAAGTAVDSATLGVCKLSADGTTLTFAAALTGVTVSYVPRSATDVTSLFAE